MSSGSRRGMKHGIYLLRFKTGGFSIAAVGFLPDGRNWWAATNHISKEVNDEWGDIDTAILIATDTQIVGTLNDLANNEEVETEDD